MAGQKWFRAAKGIRYREHATRKHGKRADRYFALQYKLDGKVINEGVGWASDGVTQDECEKLLVILRENWRSGSGPATLTDVRKLAQEQNKQQELEAEQNKWKQTTLTDYFEQYYLPHAKRIKKEVSWAKEESLFKHWISPVMGRLPLLEVDFSHWDKMLTKMDKAKLSQRTKEYAAGTLRRIMRHAQDRGFDLRIPTARQVGATAPKDNRRLRVITPKERDSILSALEEVDIHAWRLVRFAMLTGCRASEAFNLRWQDVDLDAGELRFHNTKNKDSRVIYLSAELVALLKDFGPAEKTAIVFPRSDGNPHVEAPFHFKEVVKELKLNENRDARDRISFHSIRHSVATELARFLDVRSLMDVMGWKQIAMAARYIHSNEETKRAAMTALAESSKQSQGKVLPFRKSS